MLVNFAVIYVAWTFMRVPKMAKKEEYTATTKLNTSDPIRKKVIDNLSRQKLVYAPEKGCFVIRNQIN